MMSLCNQRHCLKIPCVKPKKGFSDFGFLENLRSEQEFIILTTKKRV